jgi:hypothetical protein
MKTVVNLTQQSVIGEIENVLDTYPYSPYQQAFAIADIRQALIIYVLSRIPSLYTSISEEGVSLPIWETQTTSWLDYKFPSRPLEVQLHLQKIIHQGVMYLMEEKSDCISTHLCETVQPNCEPSHWFG